ncbi:MAG: PEP-CTERM sorting domain-containing protein [Phycisphaera sp.]|nr:PEP-CTERM sorting domain-containing protein [Phycisphaera sp.]
MKISKHPIIGMALMLTCAIGTARAEHADALIAIGPSNPLATGQYDFDGGNVVNLDTRVYEGEFEGPFGNVWTIDEPGFNALSSSLGGLPAGYSTLPGSTSVSFDALAFTLGSSTSNLWHWDGAGGVNFTPVTGPTVLEIAKSPTVIFSSILDGSATDVTGFVIDTTGSDGFLHKHIDFSVYNTDASAPATGFYLWSLEIHVGSLVSEPVYFVHGLGTYDEEAHEAAIEHVQSNLVPEPTSSALLAFLAGAVVLNRRWTT